MDEYCSLVASAMGFQDKHAEILLIVTEIASVIQAHLAVVCTSQYHRKNFPPGVPTLNKFLVLPAIFNATSV